MTTPTLLTLAALIGSLTQTVDNLEVMSSDLGPAIDLTISRLHTTIDDLNALYEAEEKRDADACFEAAGR